MYNSCHEIITYNNEIKTYEMSRFQSRFERSSWYNSEEVAQIYLYLLNKCEFEPDGIGIITLYYRFYLKTEFYLKYSCIPVFK